MKACHHLPARNDEVNATLPSQVTPPTHSLAPCLDTLHAFASAEHSQCFLCGNTNPWGIALKFEVMSDGWVQAIFSCPSHFQGYPNMLHGGIVAALLDAAMTNALFAAGIVGVTASIQVRYRRPVKLECAVVVRAQMDSGSSSRLYRVRANLWQNGRLVAHASAKFCPKPRQPVVSPAVTDRDPQE